MRMRIAKEAEGRKRPSDALFVPNKYDEAELRCLEAAVRTKTTKRSFVAWRLPSKQKRRSGASLPGGCRPNKNDEAELRCLEAAVRQPPGALSEDRLVGYILLSMDIRLVALDLDDTLLQQDLTISNANREACKAVSDLGVFVILASGRTIHSMEKYARELGIAGQGNYLVCYNGAEIWDMGSGADLYERRIPPKLCREIVRLLTDRGFPFQFYLDSGRILASRRNKWTDMDSKLTGLPIDVIDDLEPHMARGQLKFVVGGDPDELPRLYAELTTLLAGKAEILISKPYFLEILAEGTDKGDALEVLAERLGMGMDSVLAIGDAQNDLGMVEKAGFGCAPSNAIPAVRRAARYVSPFSNDEDAVAEILRHFILTKEALSKVE
jgi:Cof subfamily protein (haloacid dehalogenase superfamily)